MRRILCLLVLACAVWAQPHAVEVFGQIGYGRANDDEGSVGSGVTYGGALTVPFKPRWAVDIDVQHLRTERSPSPDFSFGTRCTLVSPALQYRRGSERTYGFVGFGAGAALAEAFYRERGREFTSSANKMTFHARVGFVVAPTGRFLVRTDLYTAFRYVSPDVGLKVGVGYRF